MLYSPADFYHTEWSATHALYSLHINLTLSFSDFLTCPYVIMVYYVFSEPMETFFKWAWGLKTIAEARVLVDFSVAYIFSMSSTTYYQCTAPGNSRAVQQK